MEVQVSRREKRSWVEINISQLQLNYQCYKNLVGADTQVMTVIKADAYGHGDVQVARMMSEQGCNLFAVSNIDEAVGLRNAGIQGEILLLGYSSPGYVRDIAEFDLTQAVVSSEYANALAETGIPIKCQFAIDTGMNRIGLNGDDAESCEKTIREFYGRLKLNGIFTHLCVADSDNEDDRSFTWSQIQKFNAVAQRISDFNFPFVHCLNSAGGLSYLKKMRDMPLINKIVRLGIILYGLKPDVSMNLPSGIKPALSWKSVVSMVKVVKRGESIGYGRTYTVDVDKVIATVTTGYADGLNRHLSNQGFVLIHGMKAPIVGRICMDQTLVDVSEIPNVRMGDVVVILGMSGNEEYNADDMAQDLGTIGYEITCGISKRVQRFYYNSNLYL